MSTPFQDKKERAEDKNRETENRGHMREDRIHRTPQRESLRSAIHVNKQKSKNLTSADSN